MPRDPVTGIYTRVSNTFSEPVIGDIIDPVDADEYFDDLDDGLNSLPSLLVTYTPPGTGGVATTLDDILDEFVNASLYGTLAQAVTYANSVTRSVYLPRGTYTISNLSIPAGMSIVGESSQNTTIRITGATDDGLILGGFNRIQGVTINCAVAHTSGSGIRCDAGQVLIRDVAISDLLRGVTVKSGGTSTTLDKVIVGSSVANSVGLQIGETTGGAPVDISVLQCTFLCDGINVLGYASGDAVFIDCQMIGANDNMAMTPQNGQGVSVWYATNCFFDQAGGANMKAIPAASALGVSQCIFTGCWFSQGVNYNIHLNATSATVDGFQFIGIQNYDSVTGINIVGANNVHILGGAHADNSNAAIGVTDALGFQLIGGKVGAYGGQWGVNNYGVVLSGTTNQSYINSNIRGNTTDQVLDTSSGTQNYVANLGVLSVFATAAGPAAVRLYEDTDNGTNYIALTAPSSMAANQALALPDATDTLVGKATTDELTNKTLTSSVGKGTWTASGTWTLPAFTLGGTVSGGGQQLNNIIIGTSTPLAGSFTTVAASTSVTVTSASANALTAGRLGATTPALQVDASTGTSITGVKIKSAASGGGVALSAIGETNVNLTLDANGSGTITLGGTSTGNIVLSRALNYGGVTLSNAVTGTGNMVLSAAPTLSGLVSHSITQTSGSAATFNGINTTFTRTVTSGSSDNNNAIQVTLTDSAGSSTSPASTVGMTITTSYASGVNTATFNRGMLVLANGNGNVTNIQGFVAQLFVNSGTTTNWTAFHAPAPSVSGTLTNKWAFLVDSGGGIIKTSDATGITSAGPIAAMDATAIPAGGTAGKGLLVSSTANFGVFFGSGAPSLSAAKGSLYLRSDGSTTNDRAYINTNGSTTWTALTTAA